MIPSVLATQYREGLIDYVEATYPVTSPIFEGSIRRFLERENAFFHEPYISVKLPFRVAPTGNERFEAIHPAFPPYVHQNKAYDRLCGDDCENTLVATGTGSGKTECFTLPILEYCYQHRGEPGIKALIIYPMNALASDQALRLAKLVDGSPELKGNVRVGMYVGGRSKADSKSMQPDRVITDHETLLQNPPDILLTNYKMLDYLLVRPHDASLWKQNNPQTLKYIVVDELHTFDGAQGTDLSCLIRRLKSRLFIQPGALCCVGTSATMGGKESIPALCKYASQIFGEPFIEETVITEDRVSAAEFLSGHELSWFSMPSSEDADELLRMASEEEEQDYLAYAAKCWFGENNLDNDPLTDDGRVELGRKLMGHSFFHSMMEVIGSSVMQPSAICDRLISVFPVLGNEVASAVLDSMLALVSHARTMDSAGHLRPFLQVQLQVWMRELRRMMAKVDHEQADFMLESDVNDVDEDNQGHFLPVVNCRECGATGWTGLENEVEQITVKDLKVFYNKFFDHHKSIRMIFPRRADEENTALHQAMRFCPKCLYGQVEKAGTTKCAACGYEHTIPAWIPILQENRDDYKCPFCNGNGMMLVGLRSTTAISAGISQLYASRFNDDKKLLAFNDNVQDAAHKASFFNARTWRFALRTAIQHFVDESANGMNLGVFGNNMLMYWHSRMTDEAFVDTFIPHNMAGTRTYETLQKTGHFADDTSKEQLLSSLHRRLKYEVLLEYGFNSRTGRTLEKSGASLVAPSDKAIEAMLDITMPRIENEAGLRGVNREQMKGFVYAWIAHMRQNGAIADSVFYPFVASGGNGYLLSSKNKSMHNWWMPEAYRTPLFPCVGDFVNRNVNFEFIGEKSWYVRKISQIMGELWIENTTGLFTALSILIEELHKNHLLSRMDGPKGVIVYGLNPDMLEVKSKIGQVCCSCCGQIQSVPYDQMNTWQFTPCLRGACNGYYTVAAEEVHQDYYAHLYSHGELVRIHAREHTGLLQRDAREALETEFKHKAADHKVWEPNLLSCTPTLEMGIDIGDLSTVVLCSIPPAQAQYLQRIGRAGRTDGNALAIAVAGTKPHDLYFYQDPMDMIAGKVEPPAIFLNASAVLERQFVAYCFDCWVKSGITDTAIPKTIKSILAIIKKDPAPQDAFPFNFLKYIRSHLSSLNKTFVQMFPGELTPDSIERISTFSKGSGLEQDSLDGKIISTFVQLWEERESLRKDIKKLKAAIDALNDKPEDSSFAEQIKELEHERKGLSSVISMMEDKNVFNFLSDEGLLPNYAFPEAGVSLKAVLTRRKERINATDYDETERITYEYGRSSSAAISEFAPDNSFYVDGHKLKIDQIDVTTSEPQDWRLCPNCDHAEPVSSIHNLVSCPACGSSAWADQGQVRKMLKVRTVYSNQPYEASRIGDESDERASKFFFREMLVDINEQQDITSGYQTTEGKFPFGYEFVRKATLREINFGESDNIGTRMQIAGHEQVRNGFRLCKYCGKIQPRGKNAKPAHTAICKAAKYDFKEPFEECMFLYREFASEAIRILIPATNMDTNSVKMESFSAAIMLGLKKHFGSVDHLGFTVMDAPVQDAEYRKQYLVIYDGVPGGTGYLKELATRPDALMNVFDLALKAMDECSCENGCYHCLFAYRQSGKINSISKRTAQELLRKILSARDSLEPIASISQIAVNTLFDSELEKRFIEAFEQSSTGKRPIDIHKQLVAGKEGYLLKIGECVWEIELQAPFTMEKGFAIASRPDFVFRPKHAGHKQRPVAVFTDGFQYHRDRIADDTRKRMAIRATNEYRVWSLSWKDVDDVLTGKSHHSGTLALAKMPSGRVASQAATKKNIELLNFAELTSFDLLLEYLSDNADAEARFTQQAAYLNLGMVDAKKITDPDEWQSWETGFEPYKIWYHPNGVQFKSVMFGIWAPSPLLKVYAELPMADVKLNLFTTGCVVVRFDDTVDFKRSETFEQAWQQMLDASNMLQFVSASAVVTETGIEEDQYAAVVNNFSTITDDDTPSQPDDFNDGWQDIIDEQLFDAAAQSMAKQLSQAGIKIPSTIGFELSEASGACVGIAEMVWEDKLVAILTEDQEEYRPMFEQNGWKVFACDDMNAVNELGGER